MGIDNGAGMSEEKLELLRRTLETAASKSNPAASEYKQDALPVSEQESSFIATTPQSGEGYGLKNVHERIVISFGDAYGVSIDSKRGEGTTVTITHPVLKREVSV